MSRIFLPEDNVKAVMIPDAEVKETLFSISVRYISEIPPTEFLQGISYP